jgi:protein phosphatase
MFKKAGKIIILLTFIVIMCSGAMEETTPAASSIWSSWPIYVLAGSGLVILGAAAVLYFIYKKRAHVDLEQEYPKTTMPVICEEESSKAPPPNAEVAAEADYPLTQIPDKPENPISLGNAFHIGSRETQQDNFCISNIFDPEVRKTKGVLGIVADGMGGLADGAEISSIVTRTMLQYFNENDSSGKAESDLLSMLNAANENVNKFLSSSSDKGGSTVVAVLIRGDMLSWVAVGDSRIYLVRNGTVIQINREHTYAVELDEKAAAGEMSWDEALSHPKRSALTGYLGSGDLEKIDRSLRPMQLQEGDRILLMSDGVFGNLTDEEISNVMFYEPQESAMKLQELTLAKLNPYQDNLTALIFKFNGKVD